MRNVEDLAHREVNLEARITRQEGEIRGLKGKGNRTRTALTSSGIEARLRTPKFETR